MDAVNKNPFKINELNENESLDKIILTEGIYVSQNEADGIISLFLSDKEENAPLLCCRLMNDRHAARLKKGDVVIINGLFKGRKNNLSEIENASVESLKPKEFAEWNYSKMPTREKMIKVQSEVLPLFEQEAPFDCKKLVEMVIHDPKMDERMEYKRLTIRGVASRFGTNPFKAPSVEISDEADGICYCFAVWEDEDVYQMVHKGDVITVEGNYLWTNPQWGVVIKNPEIKEIIPFKK